MPSRRCLTTCNKATLTAFNVLFLVGGLIILAVAIWFVADPAMFGLLQMAGTNQKADIGDVIVYIMMSVGAIMIIISFLGLYAAFSENRSILILYLVFATLLSMLQLSAAVLALLHNTWLEDDLRFGMYDYMAVSYDGGNSSLSRSWNSMHTEMECCGVAGRQDWVQTNSLWWRTLGANTSWSWPVSCCIMLSDMTTAIDLVGCQAGDRGSMWTLGCHVKLADWLRRWGGAVGASMIVAVCLQVCSIGVAAFHLSSLKVKPTKVRPLPKQREI